MIAEIFSYENVIHVLLALLALAGVVALVFLTRLLHSTRKTMDTANDTVKEAQTTIKEVRETTVPILEKASVSVDAVNAELLRLDALIGSVEEAGTKAISTVGAATELAQKPVDLLNSMTDKLRRGWKERKASAEDVKVASGVNVAEPVAVEPEPVAVEPEPEPEPVAPAPEPESEPVAPAPEPEPELAPGA